MASRKPARCSRMTIALQILKPTAITAAMLTSSNVPEPATGADPDPAAYNGASTYALAARVHVASNHTIYQSAQAGNVGHDPTTDTTGTWWTAVGPTNRWRMFDERNSSQTTRTGGIDVTITPGVICNALTVDNVTETGAIQVSVTDPVDGLVYDKTHSMSAPISASEYYAWFFDPFVYKTTLVLSDLPTYPSAAIRVQAITGVSSVAGIGVLVLGQMRTFGLGVNSGAKVGIQDYSIKTRNAFGDYEITERAYAKRATFEMWVARQEVDALRDFMASVRATPCVYILSDLYASTVLYGFYKDFEISIQYRDYSVFNAQIEGLT